MEHLEQAVALEEHLSSSVLLLMARVGLQPKQALAHGVKVETQDKVSLKLFLLLLLTDVILEKLKSIVHAWSSQDY